MSRNGYMRAILTAASERGLVVRKSTTYSITPSADKVGKVAEGKPEWGTAPES